MHMRIAASALHALVSGAGNGAGHLVQDIPFGVKVSLVGLCARSWTMTSPLEPVIVASMGASASMLYVRLASPLAPNLSHSWRLIHAAPKACTEAVAQQAL